MLQAAFLIDAAAKMTIIGIQQGVQRLFHRAANHFSLVRLDLALIDLDHLAEPCHFLAGFPCLVDSLVAPLGRSSSLLFYQPDLLLLNRARNSLYYLSIMERISPPQAAF